MLQIPGEVAEKLGHYVYLYIDPRNGQVKYVGKGFGNRTVSHLEDKRESAKTGWLQELRSSGHEPRIDILARNLTEEQSLLVERSIIDLIRTISLTNLVRGHSTEHGRENLREIIIRETAAEADISHPVLLFRIGRTFKPDMTKKEVYEMTRGVWVVGQKRRQKALYAFGVSGGIVRGVFQVEKWHKAGGTEYRFRKNITPNPNRWEFSGCEAPEKIVDLYIHKSVRKYFKKGMQNPVVFIDE